MLTSSAKKNGRADEAEMATQFAHEHGAMIEEFSGQREIGETPCLRHKRETAGKRSTKTDPRGKRQFGPLRGVEHCEKSDGEQNPEGGAKRNARGRRAGLRELIGEPPGPGKASPEQRRANEQRRERARLRVCCAR